MHSVVCGEMMTAAIDAQGRLFSWGVGPLGLGYDVRTSKPTLVRALAGQVVVQVQQFASVTYSLVKPPLLRELYLQLLQIAVYFNLCSYLFFLTFSQVAVSVNHGAALSQEMRGGDNGVCRSISAPIAAARFRFQCTLCALSSIFLMPV